MRPETQGNILVWSSPYGTLRLARRLTVREVSMTDAIEQSIEREAHLRKLGESLLFEVEKFGDRFNLARTIDVEQPVRHDGLTLGQAEQILETWKLRGPHGG
jgi:hypothetical protein